MAELLYSNLHRSTFHLSLISLPLTFSPPNFSNIHFSPLRRRFSHSSLLPKVSSDSSQLQIISKTEHSDGTVSFKFGDASEVLLGLENVDSVNGLELDREDSIGLDDQSVSAVDDENDSTMVAKIVVSNVKSEEISTASSESLVEQDAHDCNSTSIVEESQNSSVDASSSSVEDEVENTSGFEAVKHEDEVDIVVTNNVVAKCDSNVDEAKKLSLGSEELNDDKIENNGGKSLSSIVSEEIIEVAESNSSFEASVVVVSLKDEIVEPEVNNSARDDNVKVENSDDETLFIVEAGDGGKLEYGGDELSKNNELSSNPDALEVAVSLKDDDGGGGGREELISSGLKTEPVDEDSSLNLLNDVGVAEPSLSLENGKVLEAGNCSSATSNDDPHNLNISNKASPGVEALGITSETIIDRESSSDVENESSVATSSPLSSEVNGASPNVSQSDDQSCSDVSPASISVLESSAIDLNAVGFDSTVSSTVANSMTLTAASTLDSTEVHDTKTDSISESDDLSDIVLAADPVTSGITSPETSLDSLNEMETSVPSLLTSSAGASLSHSVEALAGGKDAYFVYEDWFGVADGVGQWSLEGVDIGMYGHELMENCEKLLKSMNSGIANVKELLKKSDAMTESTGSARVIIAHVANQVLHIANIGDSGFVVIRNGTVFKKSSPMIHEFCFPYALGLGDDSVEDIEEYQVEIEDGDVIVIATDGLFDNLYEEEIASIVSKALQDGTHVEEIAQVLGSKAQEVGKSESAKTPFADAAQAAGHLEYSGGKHDHVTVIVSLVKTR